MTSSKTSLADDAAGDPAIASDTDDGSSVGPAMEAWPAEPDPSASPDTAPGSSRRPGRRAVAAGCLFVVLVLVADAAFLAIAGGRIATVLPAAGPAATGAAGSPAPGAAPATAAPSPSAQPVGPDTVLVGAGDIAGCPPTHAADTAKLIAKVPGWVFTTGDNAYETGSSDQFLRCYGPTWGPFLYRTRPAIGNHDVVADNGASYFAYFGQAAGTPPWGWYSYTAAMWHVIVLDTNCALVGGCGPGSVQLAWLQADLAAHPGGCTVAIWHHPRFSSGEHGNEPMSDAFWRALYAAGAEIVINGHDHDYERFAPQTPDGQLDPQTGIREFVVGTGGRSLRVFNHIVPNSEVRDASTYGVLKLDLVPGAYRWHFIGVGGRSFSDSGSGVCH